MKKRKLKKITVPETDTGSDFLTSFSLGRASGWGWTEFEGNGVSTFPPHERYPVSTATEMSWLRVPKDGHFVHSTKTFFTITIHNFFYNYSIVSEDVK